MPLSLRARGFLIATAATVIISPDALLLRICEAEDPILVTCIRCALLTVFCFITAVLQTGDVRTLLTRSWKYRKGLLFISIFSVGTALGYPFSLQLTGAAEALLIISLSPLWAALIGWKFLGDTLPVRTRWALACAIASIILIFVPRMMGGEHEVVEHPRPNRLAGDLLALIAGFCLGAFGNSVRWVRLKYPNENVPIQMGQVTSNVFASLFALLLLLGLGRPLHVVHPGRTMASTLCMALVINLAFVGFNIAPKYILATEFGVITLLETLLGPIWVFLVYREMPSVWTWVGGLLLLATLVAHEGASHYIAKRAQKDEQSKKVGGDREEAGGAAAAKRTIPPVPSTSTAVVEVVLSDVLEEEGGPPPRVA